MSNSPITFRPMSDIHLEFGGMSIDYIGEDCLILAGDIQVGTKQLEWFTQLLEHRDVIYVMGNHEYYKQDATTLVEEMRAFCEAVNLLAADRQYDHQLIFMENDSMDYFGVRILGCTLWTKPSSEQQFAIQRMMNDYRCIKQGDRNFCVADMMTINHHSRCFLSEEHLNYDGDRLLVITHHAPSTLSIPERFMNSPLNGAYVNNMEFLMDKVKIWIHGHTHDSFNYKVMDCNVICNPRGYKNYEENPSFNPNLTFTL